MSSESLRTPDAMKCNHTWKRLNGGRQDNGSFTMVCERCCTYKEITPANEKASKDNRPLLTE